MSASGVFAVITVVLALVAIGYVWRRVATEPGSMGDGTPGSVMDANEDVRRIDLGSHTFVAQQAHEQLTHEGFSCRVVSLEQGAFGIGLGDHHYLVYNAEDEPRVREVVDALLGDSE